MKVAQLIQLLSDYPAETEVLVEGYENGYDPVHSLSIRTVAKVLNPADYDGLFDTPDNLELEAPSEKLTGVKAMARKKTANVLTAL